MSTSSSLIHTSLERDYCNIQRFEQNCEDLKEHVQKFALVPWSPGYQALCEVIRDPLLHPDYCRCDRTVFDISAAQINNEGIPLQKPQKVPVHDINPESVKVIDQPFKTVANSKVTVVFDSTESASVWHGNTEAFADVLSSVLAMNLFYVTQHCLVNLEDFELCGVKYLIFHCSKLNGAIGRLTKNTKITVRHLTDFASYTRLLANKSYGLAPGLTIPFEKLNSLVQEFARGKQTTKMNKLFVSGPSGSGKTIMIDQVCQRNNLNTILITGGTCAESKPGEAERKLREAFETAKRCPKGLVLIDQLDAICPKIRDTTLSHSRRLVKQMASLLDQVSANILVIGVTSKPNEVDPSILRAGRLENEVAITPATEAERKAMLASLFKPFAQDKNGMQELCSEAARMTPGYIISDLSLLARETALIMSKGEKNWMEAMKSSVAKMKPASLRGGLGVVTTEPMAMSQIGGLTDVKMKLKTVIEWPLNHPEAFQRMGIPRPKGILLYGPPGCAKTSLVKAIASMIGTSFLAISAAELYSSLVGESEKSLVALFRRARSAAPAVLFIDEIDALVGHRGDGQMQTGVQERVLATVLVEMDGLTVPKSGGGVLVVGATNRPDLVDAALLRPGRFDQMIHVPAPDVNSRKSILDTITSTMAVSSDVDLDYIALKTELFSGADLQQLCKEAALHALTVDGMGASKVENRHFAAVLENMKPSLSPKWLNWYSNYKPGH